MQKTLILGDTHGRVTWKAIPNQESWDHVVFLGDYFDAYPEIAPEIQLANFADIVTLKRALPDQITLLIGNHDFHYLPCAGRERYSGWQSGVASRITEALVAALDVCVPALVIDGYVITHAGLTRSWCQDQHISVTSPEELVVDVNQAWRTVPEAFRFNGADPSGCGEDSRQGPLWVRPDWLRADPAVPKQIVGHTQQRQIVLGDIVYADAIAVGQFVIVEDGALTVGTVA